MIRIVVLFTALLLASGCGDSRPKSTGVAPTTTIGEAQAIDIATQAVSDKSGWSDSVTFEATMQGALWAVSARHDDGGYALVIIGPNGEIVKYEGG